MSRFLLAALNGYQIHAGKISSGLLSKLQNVEKSDAIFELPSVFGKVMSNPALSFLSGSAKSDMMETLMKQTTSASQALFIFKECEPQREPTSAVKSLGALPGTFTLREPYIATLDPWTDGDKNVLNRESCQVRGQWGVEKIQAPAAWSKSKGENVVVGIIDTGVYQVHEAVRGGYAGKWLDATVDKSPYPVDPNGHGTHALGTIVGRPNRIGVAPAAKWIACRAMGPGGGAPESWVKTCGQWIFQQRPSVVSNSWNFYVTGTFFDDVIKSWTAAGIIAVFSSGNSGDGCRTAG
ncbi:bacillopeptidase F [Folsomia candida]|uniref:bacillopeptidase F n=1 Tax=Folsomia candida TaxID=158441 RepID=UPI000B8FE5F6|nr:bacillopeptidase F [Folsomia candida]